MAEIEKVKEVEKKEKVREKEVERKELEKEDALEVCPECGSPRLIRDYRRGEFICQDCGLVIEETYIDADDSRQRSYDNNRLEQQRLLR